MRQAPPPMLFDTPNNGDCPTARRVPQRDDWEGGGGVIGATLRWQVASFTA